MDFTQIISFNTCIVKIIMNHTYIIEYVLQYDIIMQTLCCSIFIIYDLYRRRMHFKREIKKHS